MAKKRSAGSYNRVSSVKKYKRYAGTPREQIVSAHTRKSGYGYNRDELLQIHLSRPIIDRAIDERIPAQYISERKWVMSNGSAGDLEGIDDRITTTHDLTPEQKIQVLNGILKRLGVKAQVVAGELVDSEEIKPAVKEKIRKAIPYALRSSTSAREKQAVEKPSSREEKKKKKPISSDELSELAKMLEGI